MLIRPWDWGMIERCLSTWAKPILPFVSAQKRTKCTKWDPMHQSELNSTQLNWINWIGLRVRLVRGLEKWEDRKDLVFSHVCLVGEVEKWEGGKKICLVGEKKGRMKNVIYINWLLCPWMSYETKKSTRNNILMRNIMRTLWWKISRFASNGGA